MNGFNVVQNALTQFFSLFEYISDYFSIGLIVFSFFPVYLGFRFLLYPLLGGKLNVGSDSVNRRTLNKKDSEV